jgi:hypothetical protein
MLCRGEGFSRQKVEVDVVAFFMISLFLPGQSEPKRARAGYAEGTSTSIEQAATYNKQVKSSLQEKAKKSLT